MAREPKESTETLNTQQLADLAGVTAQTIRNLINADPPRIAAVRNGRDWLIPVTAARKFLATYEKHGVLRGPKK